MSDSEEPSKKRIRITEHIRISGDETKRSCSPEDTTEKIKRLRVSVPDKEDIAMDEGDREKELAAQRRRNFLTACESVSYNHFSDHRRRFLLLYPPTCAVGECVHNFNNKESYMDIPSYAKETFHIDYKSQMWCEALHVCEMALSPSAYLPADVMLYILEIVMNVHTDLYDGYSIPFILDRCQQILTLTYRTHPPCSAAVRKCYKSFLSSPLTVKDGTLSNRTQFDCEKGIVKYCLNRLEAELKSDAKDEPLVNKSDYITEEMTQSIRGLHWQKEKLQIFETLERPERIRRLMVTLKSLVELLTADLSIWLSRHTHNQGTHIMRSQRPLLTLILWSDNILFTGAVNNNCRQIISLFVQFVRLGFPENDVRIMTQLLNSMVQTFYICEANSGGDYPHVGKYCLNFAREMFKAIKDLPIDSMIEVISRIQPTFMQHSVALLCIKNVLPSQEEDILSLMKSFLQNDAWKKFPKNENVTFQIENKIKAVKKFNRIYTNFSRIMKTYSKDSPVDYYDVYAKKETEYEMETPITQDQIIKIMLVALDAYLDAYNIEKLQECLARPISPQSELNSSYTLSEEFYKTYRTICQILTELKSHFKRLKDNPVVGYFRGFDSLHLLGL